jgi:hypothetical protein
MSKEIKHYVSTADYVDFLIHKSNQYELFIKSMPAVPLLTNEQKEQLELFQLQLNFFKLDYSRSQYNVLKGFETMEIPDHTAYSFYNYRLEKHKTTMNIQ